MLKSNPSIFFYYVYILNMCLIFAMRIYYFSEYIYININNININE